MPLTHGYNILTTGLVYNYNDQQTILSLRKYLKLLPYFEQFILLSTNKTCIYKNGKKENSKKTTVGVNSYSWRTLRLFANKDIRLTLIGCVCVCVCLCLALD